VSGRLPVPFKFTRADLDGLPLADAAEVVRFAVAIEEHGEAAKDIGAMMAAIVHEEERWRETHHSWVAWWKDAVGTSHTTSYKWVNRGRDLLGLGALENPRSERKGGLTDLVSNTVPSGRPSLPAKRESALPPIEAAPPELPPDPLPSMLSSAEQTAEVLRKMKRKLVSAGEVAACFKDPAEATNISRWLLGWAKEFYSRANPHDQRLARREVNPNFKTPAK
jgi:hypothetical protein